MTSFIATFFVALASLLPGSLAHAQSDAVKEARQEVVASITRLNELEKQNLDPATKIVEETILKRDALQNILTLTDLETKEVTENLEKLSLGDTEEMNMLRT